MTDQADGYQPGWCPECFAPEGACQCAQQGYRKPTMAELRELATGEHEQMYEITLSDNEKQIVSESELEELIESAMEFDGFLGFTYKKV